MKRLNGQIDEYIENDYISFHTPGHKGYGEVEIKNDLTELKNLESLYENMGAIAETEKMLSRIYGSKTIISASGSSLCIQTMLAMVSKAGDSIIAARNIHRSAVNAMALLDISAYWIYPYIDEKTNLPKPITSEEVEASILECDEAVAVYLTSPDYYGQYCDIEKISEVCKKHGKNLIVDCAHGAHFKFLSRDLYPTSLGADICCASLHKTLPTLTGAAILSFGNEYSVARAKNKMSIFATTSPSYLIMSSIDTFVDRANRGIETEINKLIDVCSNIRKNSKLKCLENNTDPTRITVNFAGAGYSSKEFEELLDNKRISPEFVDDDYCVFITSINNTEPELEALTEFLAKIEVKPANKNIVPIKYTKLPTKTTIRNAVLNGNIESIDVEHSEGKIAGNIVSPCPPGIPLVIPGEVIDTPTINMLKNHRIYKIDVL